MSQTERFLELLDHLEISRDVFWRSKFKQAGLPLPLIESILKQAAAAQLSPLEFLESLKE